MAKKSRHRRGLPAEIEREILIRLPVKTLRRFQSTCKSWYSLISSPQFQQDHQFFHSRNNPLLLTVREDDDDPFTLQFSAYTNSKEETLVNTFSKKAPYICEVGMLPIQSCQGLLCLASSFSPFSTNPILICNPSTEELIVLPQSQQPSDCFGFGYAASTEEFKVVNFVNGINSFCEVFTLGSAHWREVRSPPYYSWGVAPFLHGALHLPPAPLEEDNDYIPAFDLETEEYKCIPLPTCYRSIVERYDFAHQEMENIRLVVLRGSLCLIFAFGPCLEFLILKDYDNAEWEKGYTIDMSCAIDAPRGWYYPIGAIGIMGDGSVLLGDPKFKGADLWCYDPQDRFFTQKFDDILAAAFYEESFFSLGTRNIEERWKCARGAFFCARIKDYYAHAFIPIACAYYVRFFPEKLPEQFLQFAWLRWLLANSGRKLHDNHWFLLLYKDGKGEEQIITYFSHFTLHLSFQGFFSSIKLERV